jgi:hypothetical protein
MRNSLLGGLTVALAASGSVSASVWTITGASIAGVAQPVSSIRSGVIDISGGIQSALDQTFLFGPPTPIVSFDSLNFLSFSDTSGTEYFGFYWVAAAQWQIQLTSSASGTPTLQTNMTGVSSTGGSFTSSALGDSYFYLYQGVGVGSTVSITGTVPNSEIRWLDWDGAAWQVLGSGNTISNPNFALSNATMVPGGAGAALAATGLAGRLLGRRRGRTCR